MEPCSMVTLQHCNNGTLQHGDITTLQYYNITHFTLASLSCLLHISGTVTSWSAFCSGECCNISKLYWYSSQNYKQIQGRNIEMFPVKMMPWANLYIFWKIFRQITWPEIRKYSEYTIMREWVCRVMDIYKLIFFLSAWKKGIIKNRLNTAHTHHSTTRDFRMNSNGRKRLRFGWYKTMMTFKFLVPVNKNWIGIFNIRFRITAEKLWQKQIHKCACITVRH